MKRLALLILLIASPVMAGQYVVTSLPATITQSAHSSDTWDTVTFSGDLTSTTAGLTFAAGCHEWITMFNGDSISFGTDSTYRAGVYSPVYGIRVASNLTTTTNLIFQGPGGIYYCPENITGNEGPGDFQWSDTVNYVEGISLGYLANNCIIRGLTVRVTGAWRHHIGIAMGSGGHLVDSCTVINDGYAFWDRQFFPASCIDARDIKGNLEDLYGWGFAAKVTNSTIISNCGTGIYFETDDSATFYVENCTFVQDTRNIYGVDYPGAYRSTTNVDFALWMQEWAAGSYATNCDFYAGDTWNGGRGIMAYVLNGAAGNPVRISNMRCHRMHEGTNSEYQSIWNPEFIKIRGGSSYLEVDSIYGAWLIDTIETQYGGYCPRGGMIMYEYWNDYIGSPHHVSITQSQCSTLVVTQNNYAGYHGWGLTWEDIEDADTSSYSQNNHWYTDATTIYDFGQYDGNGAYARFIGDTAELITNANMPRQYTFNMGYPGGDALGNVARDLVYMDAAAPGDIGYWTNAGTVNGEKVIGFQRTLNLYVRGTNGLPVTGATVSATNSYGVVALAGTSDAHGLVSRVVDYGWYARVAADSTGYNNFTLNANKAGDNVGESFTVAWDNYTDTLDLPATVGDGTWETTEITQNVIIRSYIYREGKIQ